MMDISDEKVEDMLKELNDGRDTKVEEADAEYEELAKKLKTYLRLKKLSDHSFDRHYEGACTLLCWGSPAYCCKSTHGGGEGKECLWRGLFQDLTDMNDDEFEVLKDGLSADFEAKWREKTGVKNE